MNKEHPIDELFRAGLADASVAPPVEVWHGIVAKRSWTERTLNRVRKYWWVPLLALLFTGAGIGAAYSDHNAADTSLNTWSTTPSERISEMGSNNTLVANAGSPVSSSSTTQVESMSAKENLDKPIPDQDETVFIVQNGSNPVVSNEQDNQPIHNEVNSNTKSSESSKNSSEGGVFNWADHSSMGASKSVHGSDGVQREEAYLDAIATTLSLRPTNIEQSALGGKTLGRPYTGSAGSIPPGDWWVGGRAGYYNLNVGYDGDDISPISELNAGEVGQHAFSFDFLGGRSWRNGFFVSSGLGLDSWSTSFRFNQKQVHTSYTADSIIYIGYDSLTQTTIYDTTYLAQNSIINAQLSGTNRYSVFRLPIEAGLVKEFGRLEFGFQAGVILEFDAGRRGLSLAAPSLTSDSLLATDHSFVDLESSDLNSRYGAHISGTSALLVGYKLNEFISVYAMPSYSKRLMSLTRNTPLSFSGERMGIQFSLRYTLPY